MDQKIEINPIQRREQDKKQYPFMLSNRCGAKTRKRTACLSPAVNGKNRCRMHGGAKGSGAPKGSQNALKHGFTSKSAFEARSQIRQFLKKCRTVITEPNSHVQDHFYEFTEAYKIK